MKETLNSALQSITCRLKSRFGQAISTVIVATLALRYPWLTAWMDEKMRSWAFEAADSVRTLALPVLLLFAKGFNETGGSTPLTPEAAKRVEDKPE